MSFPLSLFFSRMESPNILSLSSQRTCSKPPFNFVVFSGLDLAVLCPFLESTSIAVSSTDEVSQEQSRWREPPPSTAARAPLDAPQDTSGFLGCECSLPAQTAHLLPPIKMISAEISVTSPLNL